MKIKRISEAYSMQPVYWEVTEENHRSKFNPENDIAKIVEEKVQVSSEKQISVYVGYNYDGKKKFKYIADAVNVHYF